MTSSNRDRIVEQSRSKLDRVRGLVDVYDQLVGGAAGRPSVAEADVLRAAVVFLHATLEDFLRNLAYELMPARASADALRLIPPAGGDGRKTTLTLADLGPYRGRSIDDFLRDSVEAHLDRTPFNNVGDIKRLVAEIGLDPRSIDPLADRLGLLMQRRHLVAHRFDENPSTGSGHHRANSISKNLVRRWIDVVDRLISEIEAALR